MSIKEKIRVHVQIERENKRKLNEWKGAAMKKVIKTLHGRLGTVTVTAYTENGRTEYNVAHSYAPLNAKLWTCEIFHAIRYAQFLAGKY